MACLLEAPLRMSVLSVSLAFQVHLAKLQYVNSKNKCLHITWFVMRRSDECNFIRVVFSASLQANLNAMQYVVLRLCIRRCSCFRFSFRPQGREGAAAVNGSHARPASLHSSVLYREWNRTVNATVTVSGEKLTANLEKSKAAEWVHNAQRKNKLLGVFPPKKTFYMMLLPQKDIKSPII